MDLSALTDEQMAKVQQFQDIANLEEMDMAVVTLASCDWNLENALEAHLGGAPVAPRVGITARDYVDYDEMNDAMMQVDDVDAEDAAMHVEEARRPASPPVTRRAAAAAARTAAPRGAASASASSSTSSVATARSFVPASSSRSREQTVQRAGRPQPAADQADLVLPLVFNPDVTGPPLPPRLARLAAAAAPAAAAPAPARPTLDEALAAVVAQRERVNAAGTDRTMSDVDSDDNDDDYDYAMEMQPEDEEDEEQQPMRANAAVANGATARRAANDFGVPLIPTDCASALEGTQNFQSVFEARYGKDGRGHLMPPFFIGSLQAAIREAFDCPDRPVSERRPLALYIHHDGSVARNIFPQAVLCNDGVLALLRSQFIVWPWDVTAKENEEKLSVWLNEASLYDVRAYASNFVHKVDRFPLLVLLSKEGSQLRMVTHIIGSESAEQAMEKLLMCMDEYSTAKVALEKQAADRAEREALRREQERELQESLAVDKERAERQAREIREAKEAEERAAKEKEEKEAYIAQLKSSLPEEPGADGPEVCTVRFRLPEQGQTLRRFAKSTPLSVLFTFLESEGFPVKEYRMMNSDFPVKKDISEWDATSTFADHKVPSREVINVEER